MNSKRTDRGSRVIGAPAALIYEAFIDPEAVAEWRPPSGMNCEIYVFEPCEGGAFRMSFGYKDQEHKVSGKTSEHADVFHGKFIELRPGKRIVEVVVFESEDPAFEGEMRIVTTFDPLEGGTEVTIACENVPSGIRAEDHAEGIKSTLENLERFVMKKC